MQVGEKNVNCYGYSGKGKAHADEVLVYMVSGNDADSDLFRVTENVKKGKHRIFALSLNSAHLVDYTSEISKQSIPLTITSLRFGAHRSHLPVMILTR